MYGPRWEWRIESGKAATDAEFYGPSSMPAFVCQATDVWFDRGKDKQPTCHESGADVA